MQISYLIYLAVLFFLLVPGVLVTLPKGGSKMVVAATHALVFIVVYVLTKKIYYIVSKKLEGFRENSTDTTGATKGNKKPVKSGKSGKKEKK